MLLCFGQSAIAFKQDAEVCMCLGKVRLQSNYVSKACLCILRVARGHMIIALDEESFGRCAILKHVHLPLIQQVSKIANVGTVFNSPNDLSEDFIVSWMFLDFTGRPNLGQSDYG
jgi:hypothetical protein